MAIFTALSLTVICCSQLLIRQMLTYNLSDVMITSALAIIMMGIGLSLTFADFKNIFIHPRALIVALGVQLAIVPSIAFLIAAISGLSDAAKVGIVIISACASGASSNLITHLFKGNVALAISMTTINTLITVVWVPFIVNISLLVFMHTSAEIKLDFWETAFQIFAVILIPATLGMVIRALKPKFALSLETPLKFILPFILATVFTIKIFGGSEIGGTQITFLEGWRIFPWCLSLNLSAIIAGFYVSRLLKLEFPNQFTVSIEVGLHNTTLALLIAGTMLNIPEMEKPAVIYAMFSFFTAVISVFVFKRVYKN
jgi:BASS family bile acid:Na+ symporter